MPPALDLHSIAVLANYERVTSDARFRHAKLREVAIAGGLFKTVKLAADAFADVKLTPKRGFIYDKIDDETGRSDLPTNMIREGPGTHASARALSAKELDNVYWQTRGHDGCYRSLGILQHFFDLYPPSQPILIRSSSGTSYHTIISTRVIIEFDIVPSSYSLSVVLPSTTIYTSVEQGTMLHSVWGFAQLGSTDVTSILDLSSMQFGEEGRGVGGEQFLLGSMDEWWDMMELVAIGCEPAEKAGPDGTSTRVGPGKDDDVQREAAKRIKERWDKRETEPWCAYCGAPKPPSKCGSCKKVWYCSKEHSSWGWKAHKKWCK